MLAEAVVWHWWLGAGLLIAGVGALLGLVGGYLARVERIKHPGRGQRRAD